MSLPRFLFCFVIMTLVFMAFIYFACAALDKQDKAELNEVLIECDDPIYFDNNTGICINAIAKKIKEQKRKRTETAQLTTQPTIKE